MKDVDQVWLNIIKKIFNKKGKRVKTEKTRSPNIRSEAIQDIKNQRNRSIDYNHSILNDIAIYLNSISIELSKNKLA